MYPRALIANNGNNYATIENLDADEESVDEDLMQAIMNRGTSGGEDKDTINKSAGGPMSFTVKMNDNNQHGQAKTNKIDTYIVKKHFLGRSCRHTLARTWLGLRACRALGLARGG